MALSSRYAQDSRSLGVSMQRIEQMPGHTEKRPNLHTSAFTKSPLAKRRLARRVRNRIAKASRRRNWSR